MRLLIWWYRALLLAYPPEFRRKYAAEMLQIVAAEARSIKRRGFAALLGYAVHLAVDAARSAFREQMAERTRLGAPSKLAVIAFAVTALALAFLLSRRPAARCAIATIAQITSGKSAGSCAGHLGGVH